MTGSIWKNQSPKTTDACPNSVPYPIRRPENDASENRLNNYHDEMKEDAIENPRLPK